MVQGIENLANRKSTPELPSTGAHYTRVRGISRSQVIFKTRELPSKSPQSNFLETPLSGISGGAFEIKPS